jgi:branched-chain amino acid transport system permease protein
LRTYGGDDGLPIRTRSDFGLFSLAENSVLYYTILVVLVIALYCGSRLVHSRFGLLLRGSKANDRRLSTLGFPTLRYKLTAYVLSALVCVVAGMLLANLTKYTSPSYMQWQVSGDLIVMIVLGGLSTVAGPVVGAAALLILEEILSSLKLGLPWGIDRFINDHWMLLIGIFIIVVVLNMKQGLLGFLPQRRK